MKHLVGLLLIGTVGMAADFTSGQAARLVIGQPTFTKQDPAFSDTVLGAMSGIAYANGMLVVADSNRVGAAPDNHRVLIFNDPLGSLANPALPISQTGDWVRCRVCVGKADVVLGQPDFSKSDVGLSQTGLRLPTAVATDGKMLIVGDTDNNRVLIWKSIPASNNTPADIVLGQPDFKGNAVNAGTGDPRVPSARSMRGPQGVWVQNGKLFVADDQNNRVLIWNSIPTANFQPADLVLGQPNFSAAIEPDLTKAQLNVKPNTLLNPVSVTSDGTRLFVADLGHNRVLIWNNIPTSNQAPADVVVGQPDLTGEATANNSAKLCKATGQDKDGKDIFPAHCAATLDFPRFALSDGKRLFVADGGNDRILVFNRIPTENGAAADAILGQWDAVTNQNSDGANPLARSSADSVRTPMALAWDGVNLLASDPFNRRLMVFTPGEPGLPNTAVRNAASLEVFAVGSISFSGSIKENEEVTITIGGKDYKYKIVKDDTFAKVISALTAKINEGTGDPNVLAIPNPVLNAIRLTARVSGELGNEIEIGVKTSDSATIVATASGAKLSGGQDAAKIAPGSLVTLLGDNLCDEGVRESAPAGADPLPTRLAGVEVYFDGVRAPLLYVSPTRINAQIPYDVNDATSVSAYVRTERKGGGVSVTRAVAVPIIPSNPGIFAQEGADPRPGVVLHGSSQASGTVSVDGSVKVGDTATIVIEDREYTYTVKDGDTLVTIRDALVDLVSQDPKVYAFASGIFTRVRIRARIQGPEGNGIKFSAKTNTDAQVILSPTGTDLCCANEAYAPVTDANPALPGETIIVYATGLGLVKPDDAKLALNTGVSYQGPLLNEPNDFVSSLAGGKTANVLFAGAKQGAIGIYEVHLELNSDLPTDPQTQATIAQDVYVSNIVTFPVFNPKPPSP